MKKVYEGVQKEHRKVFKHFMDYPKCKYTFKGDVGTVTYYESYITDEKALQEKGDCIRALKQGIIEFRNYCFNN